MTSPNPGASAPIPNQQPIVPPMPDASIPPAPPAPPTPPAPPIEAQQFAQPTGQVPTYATGQVPVYPTGQVPGYVPAPPSPFVLALKEFWPSFILPWKSRYDEALNRALGMKLYWLISYLAYSIAIAFGMSMFAGRSIASLASSMTGGLMDSYVDYTLINWPQWFFFFLLVTFASLVLRALFIKATAAVCKVNLPFTVAANIYGVSVTNFAFLFAGLFILVLLPAGVIVTILTYLLFAGVFLCTLVSEIGTWIGLNKAGAYNKEILVPHALLSLAWMVSVALLCYILLLIFQMTPGAIMQTIMSGVVPSLF